MAAHNHEQFEKEKNAKAAGITLMILIAFFATLLLVSWTTPTVPPPVVDEGIEVNLGNSDEGMGDVAPEVAGDPAPAAAETPAPPANSQPAVNEETPDESDPEPSVAPVAEVKKPVVIKTIETPKVTTPKATLPTTQSVAKAPTPKAVMGKITGGTGTGGNGADRNNGVTNQGIAGGNGDQGKPGGNPNSDSYKGDGGNGNSGVRIRSGLPGRRFTKMPSFTDEFNENAKVAVNITVNAAGKVTNAAIEPRGTTTTNAQIRAIALRKAQQLTLNAGDDDEATGTIVFDFKVRE